LQSQSATLRDQVLRDAWDVRLVLKFPGMAFNVTPVHLALSLLALQAQRLLIQKGSSFAVISALLVLSAAQKAQVLVKGVCREHGVRSAPHPVSQERL
jgi:hypothetical protein